MQFYKIIHAGGIEFDTVRTAAQNRAKETGGTWEAIEMATDKSSIIAALNDLAREAAGVAPIERITAPVEIDEEAAPRPAPTTTCPKCKITGKAAEQYAAAIKRGLHVEAVKAFIEEKDGWELSAIVEATTRRLSDMARRITGKEQRV